jgi:HAD superfamily hydrolase (TIGR01490 family)
VCDIAWWRHRAVATVEHRRDRRHVVSNLQPPPSAPDAAAFFDLDRTLISGSSTFTFGIAAWRASLLEGRQLTGDAVRALSFRLFGASDERTRQTRDRLLDAIRGTDEVDLAKLSHAIVPRLVEQVRPESRELIEWHREAGRDQWIVSASAQGIVDPLAHAIGMTGGIGTRVQVSDGTFTGELDGPFVYGEGKVVAIRAIVRERGYDLSRCYAYSDSISDRPMLELVGHPVAVNPDRELETLARALGWPIVIFARRAKRIATASTIVGTMMGIAATAYGFGLQRGRAATPRRGRPRLLGPRA